MIAVFDAAALIAWFNEEPAAAEVDELLAAHGGLASCVNLVEVVDNLGRIGRIAVGHVASVVDALIGDGMVAVPCDVAIGLRAGVIRATHYNRVTCAVSLADCVATATAEAVDGTLITSDAQLVALAEALGVAVHPIPNSRGTRPPLVGG